MDAVAFPPAPAPFLDDHFDFGDFIFTSAPQAPRAPAAFAAFDDDWGDFVASPLGSNPDASAPPTTKPSSSSSWEKPRGPLPLSMFGADDDQEDGREEEGPAGPPPTATAAAHQHTPSFCSGGSRPADLKDLIAGLYGSQPPSAASAADAGTQEEAVDDDGFGDDGWEFKAASAAPAGQDGDGQAHGDEIGQNEEINEKLQDLSLPKGFCTEHHPSRDVCITELLNSIKVEHRKDFEQEYHLAEKAMDDTSVAVELYKHSVSTPRTLELASKEEQCDYVSAWYNMLLFCAQELQHGAAVWQQSCHANVYDQVISEGGHCFIALGEIYRVAQILYFSLQCFKPWVLANPGMLSKLLACLESCSNAWTSCLQTALKMVVDSAHLDASVAKALMESIKNINELEVSNLQNSLPTDEITCRLTLLPASLVPGMKVTMWNGDHYFVKVANLWANRISSDPPQLSQTPVSSTNNAATLAHHVE
ncbi:uncharacterized protein LOC133904687 isoform X2 [Phragmites australis]|uniref:uncharacterized protein LOC133904687 isoform X2 n=1 Tax=Phragmites australis TaxID=29695 RepID=UPI002D78B945|nr:uncharacterized protein LOC133904687 isoform X2 [Phragmites australis]